jgi:hypothetical protein
MVHQENAGRFEKWRCSRFSLPRTVRRMTLDRRRVLFMCAGMSAMLLPSLAGSETALPGGPLRTFMRMRGLGHRPVAIGYLEGIYHGVVDGALTPLFGVVSATFASYREVEGEFEIRSAEIAYFTHLETGEVLDNWRNPYTEEVVSVPVSEAPATASRIGADLRIVSRAALPPGVEVMQSVSPPQVVGSEVWFTETIAVLREARGKEPAFHFNDTTVLRARLSEIDKYPKAPVRCSTSYQAVVSWRPWLKMGLHPGCMVGFGHGFYGASIDELPANWTIATKRRRPEILSDPSKLLEADNAPSR